MTNALRRITTALADRYRIERELGKGGMATVYLGHDLRHDRQVAIKVLLPELAATLGPERFHREIKIAAQLQHPHIVPLLDSGQAEDFLYYVMPYVEGESLRERLTREGELPIGEAVRILRDVADALTEAHAHGVAHRDIKPENILLRGRHALVTDFGVAKAVSEATGREQLTTAGVALGTPAYMAPEQATADPHIDHRVDVYAVGAVAYELLAGRPVFLGTTPQMVLSAHVTETPQPLTKHRESVPPALEALVMRCLQKKPADRWQSAEELLTQLETLTTPSAGVTPTDTRPASAPPRVRPTLPRLVIGILVAAVLVVGAWWILDRDRGAVSAPLAHALKVAVLPFENLSTSTDEEYLSEGITQDINTQLSKIAGFVVIAHGSARRVREAGLPIREAASQLGVDYLLDGSVTSLGGRVRVTARLVDGRSEAQVWADEYDRTLSTDDIFTLRSDVARQVANALKVKLSPADESSFSGSITENLAAYNAYQLGRFFWNKRTDVGLRQAITQFQRAIDLDSGYAVAYAGLADSYMLLPFYGDVPAREAYPRARAAALRALSLDSMLAEAHTSLGAIHWWHDWDWNQAERQFRDGLRLNPSYATGHHWYGAFLAGMGRTDEGIAELRRALELDPLSAVISTNVGDHLMNAGRYDEALEQYARTVQMHPEFATDYALALALNQQFDRALEELARVPMRPRERALVLALAGRRAEASREAAHLAARPMNAVQVLAALGRAGDALDLLERAFDERDANLVYGDEFKRPFYDAIRSHPRFVSILKQIGFDPQGNALGFRDAR